MFWIVSLFSRGSIPASTLLRCLSLMLPVYLLVLGLLSLTITYFGSVIECSPSTDRFFVNSYCLVHQHTDELPTLIYYRFAPMLTLIFGFALAMFSKFFPKPYFSSEYTSFKGLASSEEHAVRLRLLEMLDRSRVSSFHVSYVLRKLSLYFGILLIISARIFFVCYLLELSPRDLLQAPVVAARFPSVTSCFLRLIGASGTLQFQEFYCSLPLNEWYFYSHAFELLLYAFYALLFTLRLTSTALFSIPRIRVLFVILTLRGHSPKSLLRLDRVLGCVQWHVVVSLLSKLPSAISSTFLNDILENKQTEITPII